MRPTGWHRVIAENFARAGRNAARKRKLGRLHRKGLLFPFRTSSRHAGMFGYVREMDPANRALVDAWLAAHKDA
jgi:hypothetical protein